ncbi:MAG: SDR family oxidoreductase [Rhodopirellula sp.]|nr:SDR family oxidoreductase [Rhodopirellula sp.]
MSENVVILGAGSGIAKALCQRMAARGCSLALCGRDTTELERDAADLRTRHGVKVSVLDFDALHFETHDDLWNRCLAQFDGHIDGAVLCFGTLPDQKGCEVDQSQLRTAIDVNLTAAASILNPIAAHLESNKSGWLAVVSSVAGDRGRQSNYIYGAAKAGLTAYLAGLRNRLQPSGVHVLTVKPGFVATPMTAGILDPKSPMVASPERVAQDIDRAIEKRRNVIYTPWFWKWIMVIIRNIPEPIFKRLKL